MLTYVLEDGRTEAICFVQRCGLQNEKIKAMSINLTDSTVTPAKSHDDESTHMSNLQQTRSNKDNRGWNAEKRVIVNFETHRTFVYLGSFQTQDLRVRMPAESTRKTSLANSGRSSPEKSVPYNRC